MSLIEDPFFASYTTKEVHIVSEPNPDHAAFSAPEEVLEHMDPNIRHGSVSAGPKNYTVNISASSPAPLPNQLSEYTRTAQTSVKPPQTPNPNGGISSQNRKRAQESNNAAWSYTKVSVLFFTAMLITWIPSSANRVYSVMHPGDISPSLEFLSAFVLPLQGFWNALIYITTSRHACRMYWSDITFHRKTPDKEQGFGQGYGFGVSRGNRLPSRGGLEDSESMTELAVRSTPADAKSAKSIES